MAPKKAPPEQREVISSFSLLVTGLLSRSLLRYTRTAEMMPVSYPKSRPAVDAVRATSHTNQLTGRLSMSVTILSILAAAIFSTCVEYISASCNGSSKLAFSGFDLATSLESSCEDFSQVDMFEVGRETDSMTVIFNM